jgi:hypothetical protein
MCVCVSGCVWFEWSVCVYVCMAYVYGVCGEFLCVTSMCMRYVVCKWSVHVWGVCICVCVCCVVVGIFVVCTYAAWCFCVRVVYVYRVCGFYVCVVYVFEVCGVRGVYACGV